MSAQQPTQAAPAQAVAPPPAQASAPPPPAGAPTAAPVKDDRDHVDKGNEKTWGVGDIVSKQKPPSLDKTILAKIYSLPPRSRSRPAKVRRQIYAQGPEESPCHKREDHRFRAQVFREEGVRSLFSLTLPLSKTYPPAKRSKKGKGKPNTKNFLHIESKFPRASQTKSATPCRPNDTPPYIPFNLHLSYFQSHVHARALQ